MTRLLVSVRSATEAIAAIAGGADIIDVKEPMRGSLGMADTVTIAEIVRSTSVPACDSQHGSLLVSAALGEVREWLAGEHGDALPKGLTYAKLGLAGLAGVENWQHKWMCVRDRIGPGAPQWIAVAYVDHQSAKSPPPQEVIAAAAETNCAGVLFDTFHKTDGRLLDWLPLPELTLLVAEIRSTGMLAALAGGLSRVDIPSLMGIGADILAIRTAACVNGRNGTVTESAVRQFRAAMDSCRTAGDKASVAHRGG